MSRSAPVYFKSIPDAKIVFNYVPQENLTSGLNMTNITDQPIAFKVKTNVPASYVVKPHLGIILPQQSVDISITRKPTDYNPQKTTIQDKFLISAIPLHSNIDLSTLSDQVQFYKTWEGVPEPKIQAIMFPVALQFENNSQNTSILDKTGKPDTGKDISKDTVLNPKSASVYFKSIPDAKIVFNYVPRENLTSGLNMTNITDQPIAFKVKTNVPASYIVKPHLGIILPQRSVDISITRMPTDYNPQNAAIKDKFLVNAILIPSNTDLSALSDQAQFYKTWEGVPEPKIQAIMFPVVLQFESNSRNISILDKTGELNSSTDISIDVLLDSKRKDIAPADSIRKYGK